MKTLYFDIDGTLLVDGAGTVKSLLGNGNFEDAVRRAGFTSLVCVGNFADIARIAKQILPDYDEIGALHRLCLGAFQDEAWLRSRTSLVEDAANRAAGIDPSRDWWYVDDLAAHYMRLAGRQDLFEAHLGGRICVPGPHGDGGDVLEWLISAAP